MLAASEYYERQASGLGREFLAEVQRTVHGIVQNPGAGPVVQQPFRRRFLLGFPFSILYRVDTHEIVIVAVMHLRRRPGYWAGRM
jgi:plasmid stabilization system protein ParE